MEAQKLKQKKQIGQKGKIKKTIKNVICRPDTVLWPAINDVEKNVLKSVLESYRVRIPKFIKPPWKELKLIPKNERPKVPPIKRVDGLLFGISECKNALQTNLCCAVLIDGTVNPRTIVQPIIDKCSSSNTPVLCMENLKTLTKNYFGIKTSCLGVNNNCLLDLSSQIKEIYQQHKPKIRDMKSVNGHENAQKEKVTKMDVDEPVTIYPYLLRTDKKTRMFNPSNSVTSNKAVNKFSGQHFIKVLDNDIDLNQSVNQSTNKVEKETDRTAYMRMILKKISNNPNRVKIK